ncbi:ribosomal protein S18-alanine N-acetyltransferase [Hydromonas duriensis]|uniref:[Ribosomal protein bS18]-alanine N-acetyltransferase n=1 Tax=Hydromonas duriensis TaxID=1527608 RepID=A0A4R6Y9P3_9BURK|nr:ribosomal protein S18-alanine N-acetyltransferase [Hydromonas duriensis]TDR32208.1 [SSU ribosomal protein S18P]-alanine acetyltransferase [Hydromonas duriensis]
MSLIFRSLSDADLPDVADIEAAVHIEPWSRSQMLGVADLLTGHYAGWVAVQDGRIVAYLITQVVVGEMEVLTVGVAHGFQGRGIACGLLNHAFEQAKIKCIGLSFCFLEVRVSNLSARALYRKLGFVEVGRRIKYYQNSLTGGREDALILRLDF